MSNSCIDLISFVYHFIPSDDNITWLYFFFLVRDVITNKNKDKETL